MRILITGAQGHIGRKLSGTLDPPHELVLLDRVAVADPRARLGDVTDLASVEAAMPGVEAVVHLAIASGLEGEVEDDAFNDLRFEVNVAGTFHVLEAARRAGVRRLVYASSLMVVWGYGPDELVGPDATARPIGTYALTKHLGEVMCEQYARQHGLSIVCLRIAKPIDPDDPNDPFAHEPVIRPQWIHMADLCQAFRLAVEAPSVEFEIIHLVGESSRRRWDLGRAAQVLGYRPQHRLEDEGYRFSET